MTEFVKRMREAAAKATFLAPGTPECEEAMQAALARIRNRTPLERQEAVEGWRKWSVK